MFKLMEFLHGKIYVMEDKKKYVFIFSNSWWENSESNYSIYKKKKIPHADKAYILSRYSSSFIDFPRTIIDSKEALSEVQQDWRA